MRGLLRRLRYLCRQRQLEADLATELEFHRAMKQLDLEKRGTDPSDAGVVARKEVGSVALARDRSRDVWIPAGLQDIGRDFRFAVRLIRKEWSFTAMVAVVLGLGIGIANVQYVLLDAI